MKKKILALALVVILLLSFAACSKKTIVGKWKWEVNFGPIVSEQLADSGMGEFFDFSDLKLQLNMEFKEDGTCSAKPDEASSAQMLETFATTYVEGITAYCTSMGITLEDLNMTEEDLTAQAKEEFDIDALGENLMPGGQYEVVGDKLFTWSEGEEKNEEEYMTIKLEGDTLTLVSVTGASAEAPEGFFPATLTRVG